MQYFGETLETSEAITNIYAVMNDTGEIIIYPDADLGDGFNISERDWYIKAKEAKGNIVWSEPYIDASTGKTVTTVSKAYYKNNALIGVVGADVTVETLIDIIDQIEIGETGFGVILDQNGKYIAHPDKEYIGKDVSNEKFYKKIKSAGEQGVVKYKNDGEDEAIGFVTNSTTGWIIGGNVYTKDFQKQAMAILFPISITFIIVIALAVIASLLITKGITAPIKKVMARMKAIANGDLSHAPLEIKHRNEIGQLVTATNDMNQSMRNVLNQISTVSDTVSSQSEELTQAAEEVKTGTKQIASTMGELADGSEKQANSASDLSSFMGTFASKVEQTNHHGDQIQVNSSEVLEMTTEGNELMNNSTKQMEQIDNIVKDAVVKMQNLDNQSKEISKLISVIKDVADQTNLLALNAAIEASRAGEHGKGFAVVADEVRKLAEQVALSVNDITDIVTNIQKESSVAANSLKEGYAEVEKGTKQIETTGKTFNNINTAVTEMVQYIQDISDNLSEMAANSQEINSSIEEIAAITEESAAGVQQTAASSEQASSSMEEVAGSSEHLAKLAEELNDLVREFKL